MVERFKNINIDETYRASLDKAFKSSESYLEYLRSLAPYQFVAPFVRGTNVLDIGCGEGVGSRLLIDHADRIIAIDLSAQAIRKAQNCYIKKKQNLIFSVMDGEFLGFRENSFDFVILFEVIEHIDNPASLLKEIRRVLKDNGFCFISTPNRKVRLLPFQKPWNIYHIHEFSNNQLRKLLMSSFKSVALGGIFGKGWVHDYYLRRWKQNPFVAYSKMLIPKTLHFSLKNISKILAIGKVKHENIRTDSITNSISSHGVENFFSFSVNNLKNCLNFLAICRVSKD